MKNKFIFVLVLILTLFLIFYFNPHQEITEDKFEITIDSRIKQGLLDDFGVQIDKSYTNHTVILNENPIFYFAFDYNVSISCFAGLVSYGNGEQPSKWYNSREINFTKYGDNEEHFLETRMYGGLNVYIDDIEYGLSNFDVEGTSTTNQTVKIPLEKGVHYLTILAAEYQLPYIGATIDEVQLVLTKDQHIFYVVDSISDPLPNIIVTNIQVSTIGTPYTENFEFVNGLPLEGPNINITNIDLIDSLNPVIHYVYNVSTDGIFSVSPGYLASVKFNSVGNGEVIWWVNNNSFASSPEVLYNNQNYVFICAISSYPEDIAIWYGNEYYPALGFDTSVMKIFVETTVTNYEEQTIITTETIETTETTWTTQTHETTTTITITVPGDNEVSVYVISILTAFGVMIYIVSALNKKKGVSLK